MELRHIRYFLEIADTLSFSRAAERLRVGQPALSRQIRDLESELGGRLFHRTTVAVSLTEMGHYFRQQTRKIIMQLDIAVTGAQQLAKGTTGTLRVGCDWRLPGIPIAAATRRIKELNRRLTVHLIDMPSYEHAVAVRKHSLDIGFVPSIFLGDTGDLELRNLYTARLKVVLPAGHRLSSRASLTLRELKNERWLALASGSMPGYRVMMSRVLQFTPKFGVITTSLPGLVAHVIAGDGIGLLPAHFELPNDGSIVAINTDSPPLGIFAIALRRSASPLVGSFLDLIEALIAPDCRVSSASDRGSGVSPARRRSEAATAAR